jgi:homoserine kinase type II
MAVYTKVSEPEAASFLEGYDLGTLESLTGIKQGISNSNYILRTTQDRFILTLYEKRTKIEDLPFFLGLMDHCAKKGISCPRPLPMKSGDLSGVLAGRPAALTSFLEGVQTARIQTEECAELGRALAHFHLAAKDFPLHRPNALSLPAWEGLFHECGGRADDVQPGLAAMLQAELAFLRAAWPQDLPKGIVHADLFPDNVFFTDGTLSGLIDFYFACDDMLVYDLAVCFNAWCFERHVSFNITKARAMVRSYEEIRPLEAAEKKALPLLARGADLRFLLTRLYDWLHQVPGALVKAKDPHEYRTRLDFHRTAKSMADYGITA